MVTVCLIKACKFKIFTPAPEKRMGLAWQKFDAELTGTVGFVSKVPEGGAFEQLNTPDFS